MSIPLNWPTVAALVTLGCCLYLLGRSRMTEYQDQRVDFTFNHGRRHAAAIRYLYALLELPPPPLDEEPPEPQPRWWTRAWAAVSRQQRAEVEEQNRPDEANALVKVEEQPDHPYSCCDAGWCAIHEPSANPDTAPIVMPEPVGVPTQPDMKQAAQVAPTSFEEWQKEFRARAERDLAEIRGES